MMENVKYFDREGVSITEERYIQLRHNENYRMVIRSRLGPYSISCVWVGWDYDHIGDETPSIFETMILDILNSSGKAEYWRRYKTEQEAIENYGWICCMAYGWLKKDSALGDSGDNQEHKA